MELLPHERAQAVVRYLAKKNGITQAQVGLRLGYTNKSALSAVLNGSKPLPEKFCAKLAALDPSINPDFLAGTSDEMLRPGFDQPAVLPTGSQQVTPSGPHNQKGKMLVSSVLPFSFLRNCQPNVNLIKKWESDLHPGRTTHTHYRVVTTPPQR